MVTGGQALDAEDKKRIGDFFEGHELVEFLQIKIHDVIEIFEEEIDEHLPEIEELMGINHD